MEDSGTEQIRCMSDDVGIDRGISFKADGSKDWKNLRTLEFQASQIAEREQLQGIRSRDLATETVAVRKSKKIGLD